MNKKILLSTISFLLPAILFAQITINSGDLPSAGGMYGVVVENAQTTVDYSSTGANHTWDFTALGQASTAIDTFFHLSDLSTDYQTYFAGADMADNFGGGQSTFAGLTLGGSYTCYNKLFLGFYERGFAGTVPIINTTVPFIFVPGDQLVKFPLNYNDQFSTSCIAFFTIPTVAGLNRSRQRDNLVDGWGTLQLPSGNYNTLRVKSDIMDHDSLHIDLIGQNTVTDRVSHEYKWYASGKGIPVLQITTNDIGGTETVSQIFYQDPALLPNSIATVTPENSFQLFPNPTSDYAFVLPSEKFHNEKMLITDVAGKVLSEIPVSNSSATTIDLSSFSVGIYFVQFLNEGKIESVQKLVVNR